MEGSEGRGKGKKGEGRKGSWVGQGIRSGKIGYFMRRTLSDNFFFFFRDSESRRDQRLRLGDWNLRG